ncbi:hypothetical protein [Rheinheimera texasensis]|uniref:hypothetical protein n=1 Tax=Rheinheimera texasensis TaxID=306205 RepID=UPI0004E2775D|nr:hypothetical protein [Rheinheimera texasensis]
MRKLLCMTMYLGGVIIAPAYAEVAVIVHPSNQQNLSDTDIKNLFSGKQKSFPDGNAAIVLSLPEGDSNLTVFNSKALGKSDSQMKAYWSKVMFTGKGTPPKEVSQDEMLKLVAENPSTIGIVDAGKVSGVRVVGKY